MTSAKRFHNESRFWFGCQCFSGGVQLKNVLLFSAKEDFARQNVSQLAPAWPSLRSEFGGPKPSKMSKKQKSFLHSRRRFWTVFECTSQLLSNGLDDRENEQKKKKSRPEHQQHEQRRQKQQQIHRKRGEERGERREDWGASAVSSRALIWRFWYEGRTWPTRRPPKTTLNLNITRMCTVPHGKVTTSQYKANKASSECALFPKESWSVATDFGHPRKEKRETTWKRKKHFLKENKRKIKE